MVTDRRAPDSPLFQLLESLLNRPVELTLADRPETISGVLIASGPDGVILELVRGALMAMQPELITSVQVPAPPHPAPAAPVEIPKASEKAAGAPPTVDWDSFADLCPMLPIAGGQPDEPGAPDVPASEPQPAEHLHTFPQLYQSEPINLATFQRPSASWHRS